MKCTNLIVFVPAPSNNVFFASNLSSLIASLWDLWDQGYAYAIIGAAGPVDFYVKTVNATIIPDSAPGIYTDMLERS